MSALIDSLETHRRTLSRPGTGVSDRWTVPVLQARRGDLAQRIGQLGRHPILVFVAAMVTGLALTAALSIGLGLLVTHVVEHAWSNASGERFDVWLAAHRTQGRTDASLVGSIIGGGVVLPIVAAVIAAACAVVREWRIAAFVVFALGVESASYRITTLAVHTPRPNVHRLESLPANASYPSGHTAAAIAVYCGIALLITSKFSNRIVRAIAWTVAVGLVVFVACSRMYRGMHHPIDIAGGIVVGIAALIVLVFACRASGAAAE
jgi:undecaprenyl-diphosphatase